MDISSVQKDKSDLYLIAVIISLVIIILGGVFISREFAIQMAVQECDSFHLRAEEQPSQIRTRINTYWGALRFFHENEAMGFTKSASVVWIVEMKGKWLLFGPPPPEGQPDPGPINIDQCTVIVNAFTARTIRLRALVASTGE